MPEQIYTQENLDILEEQARGLEKESRKWHTLAKKHRESARFYEAAAIRKWEQALEYGVKLRKQNLS